MSLLGRSAAAASDGGDTLDVAEESIAASFERRAASQPRSKAVASGDWQPDYEELNRVADRLACQLHARVGCKGERIALLMRHDSPLVAAVIGVLKTGSVVVVLNPTDPPDRHRAVLSDAQPALVLSDQINREAAVALETNGRRAVCWDDLVSDTGGRAPEVRVLPDDVAFLIYTSGSTGRPKGVIKTHRNVLHNAARVALGMDLQVGDRLILLTSPSGGNGVATLCSTLLYGATLCPFPIMERGVRGLATWIREHEISVFGSSASVFRHFMKTLADGETFPLVRLVRLGSEPVSSDDFTLFRRHFEPGCTLLHTLSSSETGNITQLHLRATDRVSTGRLSVGRAVQGIELHVVDGSGRDVAPGQSGQLIVRSRYLSPGYWGNPKLTAECFGAPPVNGEARNYRSGDTGRFTAEGLLFVEGRNDTRVKIHGYRVELSEVEAAILRQPGVTHAVVAVRAQSNDDPQLVAYLTCEPGSELRRATLQRTLRSVLPGYMVPTVFVLLDEFPFTPHGKIDRNKLAQMAPGPAVRVLRASPMTETELLVARIWSDALGHDHVEKHADFFELGGDSLTAATVVADIYGVLEVEVDLSAFAKHSVLSDFASLLDNLIKNSGAKPLPRLLRASRKSLLPLSFEQERTWRFSQTPAASAGYTIACSHRIVGELNVDAFVECIDYMSRRHEILRTTFEEVDGRPVQTIHRHNSVTVPLVDLSEVADPEEEATRLLKTEARRPFDLARLPLIRFFLVRIRDDEHWLVRVNHHIISDSWSWKIYFRELKLLYEARVRGLEPPLSEFEPLQYCDYAHWQRRALAQDRPAYRLALNSWKTLLAAQPPALQLPFERTAPLAEADPALGLIWWGTGIEASSRLESLQRTLGVSYFVVRLAAFAAALADETGQDDLVLGTYVTNRRRFEFQAMIGFFANLATLRLRCDQTQTFGAWVSALRRTVNETQARSEIPYEQLCEELRKEDLSPPEIRAIFSVSEQTGNMRIGGLELSWLDRRMETMPWGFTLNFDRNDENRRCRADFDARIYDPDRVRAFIGRLVRFLDTASLHPDLSLFQLLEMSRVPDAPESIRMPTGVQRHDSNRLSA